MEGVRRWFVVDCPGVPVDGAFNTANLLQGRVDNACRVVTAAVFLSHGMRQDTAVTVVCGGKPGEAANSRLAPACAVTFVATELRGFWPDEKSISTKLAKALRAHHKLPAAAAGGKGGGGKGGWGRGQAGGGAPAEPVVGVTVEDEALVEATDRARRHLEKHAQEGVLRVLLHEEGDAMTPGAFAAAEGGGADGEAAAAPALVVLGGPDGLSEDVQATMRAAPLNLVPWRIPGPSLHAASCVTIITSMIDAAAVQSGGAVKTACAAAAERAAERTARPGGRAAASYSFAASAANPLGGKLDSAAEKKDKKEKKKEKKEKRARDEPVHEDEAPAKKAKKEKKDKKQKKE